MAKHNKKSNTAHNNKEFQNNNKDPKRQDIGVYVNVSKEDRESAEIAVELVQDAFALHGIKTKVIDYRTNLFNSERQRRERNVRIYGVRPVDDQGHSINFGVYGTELSWAALHTKLKKQLSERDEAVKQIAESKTFRNLLQG